MNPATANFSLLAAQPLQKNYCTLLCFYLTNGCYCARAESCIEIQFIQWNEIYVRCHWSVITLTCIAHTGTRLLTQKIKSLSKSMKKFPHSSAHVRIIATQTTNMLQFAIKWR